VVNRSSSTSKAVKTGGARTAAAGPSHQVDGGSGASTDLGRGRPVVTSTVSGDETVGGASFSAESSSDAGGAAVDGRSGKMRDTAAEEGAACRVTTSHPVRPAAQSQRPFFRNVWALKFLRVAIFVAWFQKAPPSFLAPS
jgi:hypothetical protein